ncbi:MAG: NAD-dependent epimerase/dehydratase family protein [Candidatus Calescibacterium sp.]|nr:NAD-dependent epimerase/dehydratase family protein [Candidatus Calescibacterium sp.]
MIKWLTNNIGTGSYEKVISLIEPDVDLLDVRDLVDKEGNNVEAIKQKINQGLNSLIGGKKLVICCDYGMSRSNSIAMGIIAKYYGISLLDALNKVKGVVSETDVKLSVLHKVLEVLDNSDKEKQPKIQESKKILITGANGFIGRETIPLLKNDGHLLYTPPRNQLDIEYQNISLSLFVREKQIDTVIHLANPRVYTSVESLGKSLIMLKNILDVCAQNKIRIIYVSGWEVYSGYKSICLYADETLPALPKGTYAETKWLSEQLIEKYHQNYQLNYVILRSSPIYGVGSDKPKFIYNFIDKAIKNEPIITHEYLNGKPSLDLLHIKDFARALQKAIFLPNGFNSSINLGTGNLTSTFEIANMIIRVLSSHSEVTSLKIEDYCACIAMKTDKAQRILSWQPTIDVDSGINEILQDKYLI